VPVSECHRLVKAAGQAMTALGFERKQQRATAIKAAKANAFMNAAMAQPAGFGGDNEPGPGSLYGGWNLKPGKEQAAPAQSGTKRTRFTPAHLVHHFPSRMNQ
jgi:hypothetical protein